MEPKFWKIFSNWSNIQFKVHFLTKKGYFPQNDSLRAIQFENGHFLNFQISLFWNFWGYWNSLWSPNFEKTFQIKVISSSKFTFWQRCIFSSKWCLTSDLAQKQALFVFSNKSFLKFSMVEKQFMDLKISKNFSNWGNIRFKIHFLTKNGYFP